MTAFDDLRQKFTAEMSKGAIELGDYRGREWWQLSHAEESVFGIGLADMPALVIVWGWFAAVADIAHNDFHDAPLCLAMRSEAGGWIKRGHLDLEAWQRFAQMFAIPTALSFRWYWKQHFHFDNPQLVHREDDDWPWPSDIVPF